jgi:hypothetical protein
MRSCNSLAHSGLADITVHFHLIAATDDSVGVRRSEMQRTTNGFKDALSWFRSADEWHRPNNRGCFGSDRRCVSEPWVE